MKEIKIFYVLRQGTEFAEAEKSILEKIDDGWELVSVSGDPADLRKLIVTMQRK